MVAVGVCYHRPVHGTPGVDEESASLAIEAAVGGAEEQLDLAGRGTVSGCPGGAGKSSGLRTPLDDAAGER